MPATRWASSAATAPARPACSGCSAARPSRRPAGGAQGRLRLPAPGPTHRRACSTAARPSPTCCRVGASTSSSTASRSCASPWRSDPTSATSPATAAPRRRSASTAGTPPRAKPGRSPPDWASTRAVSSSPIGVLSGGERRRVELARILFAGSDVLCLDEPTNHLDVDAKDWLMGFLRQYRGALLVISHDLDLLDEAITRVLHLDRPTRTSVGEVVEYRAPTASTCRPAPTTTPPGQEGAQQSKEIARMQTVVDRFGAKATKAAMAHSIEKRIARLEARAGARPRRPPSRSRVRFPEPPSCGQTVVGPNASARATAGRRCSKTSGSTSAAVSGCSCSGSTARARPACCASSPRRPPPTSATFEYGHHVTAGYYAQEHDNLDVRRESARQHPHGGATGHPAHRDRAARPARHVRAVGRARCSRTPARCRAARRPSSRWRC
jgi:hypothetical protein